MTVATNDTLFGTNVIIVSPNISDGANFTTIAAAITAASSGDIIFIRPGTYTEDLTLIAGITIASHQSATFDSSVTIVGKMTAGYAGSTTLNGIKLKTNSDYALVVSGANATVLTLNYCSIEAADNSAMNITAASSAIHFNDCVTDLSTTGVALFVMTAGDVEMFYCNNTNSGGSTTSSTISAGEYEFAYSHMESIITTSTTGEVNGRFSSFVKAGSTLLVLGGAGCECQQLC